MFEREYIIIDPLGDPHVRRVPVLEGGNWDRRSYRDEYYRIGRYCRAPLYHGMSEDTEAAIRMIAQNTADRRQATFRWMCGRPR